ncbi:Fe-S cluster assembly protein SufD [Stenotrophomonas mori]|uniref:Fe-S cluster assembly protein SufD n=1 Tax=Stenotrophomonas mori TaxID=2871096 RepID=A0ABT0SK14_9GAMM|nr:Fe-S cluster assembly protein SufD [Stenotrophomonas mori]MCL7715682.1 Fe-S cluster assembly protein SufD [Stenotrophomonas mori]
MSALLESLAAGFRGSHERAQLLEAALQAGLPAHRDEAWKYTSLRQLERRRFGTAPQQAAAIDTALLAGIPAPRLVFVNGRHAETLSDLAGLDAGVQVRTLSSLLATGDAPGFLGRRFERPDEVFAQLNAALADEGVLVDVAEDVAAQHPLHLVFVSAPQAADPAPESGAKAADDIAWHHRHRIELRRGARLGLVEHHLQAGDSAHLDNTLVHVHLARDAALSHARVQTDAARATSLLRTDAVLARDAQYRRIDLELGAALTRHELNVRLEGDNALLVANGVLLGTGRRHLDTRLGIEHIARDTRAELVWRGIASDRSRVVFHGGIGIRAGADGTDANLSNKNLLLSADAEIDTQPTLVIDADEVKAAHGATVGQLDADALFYLRTRGLPAEQARALLSAAFCHEPLAAVDGALTATLAAHLDQALQQVGMA